MRRTAPSLDIVVPEDRSDLSAWTPQQVDTALAEIYKRASAKRYEIAIQRSYLADEKRRTDRAYWLYREADQPAIQKRIAKYEAAIAALRAEVAEIMRETLPFDAEYDRRPWTRAWIVTSSDGHVHNTMDCSTCNKVYRKRDGSYSDPTEFGWLPQVSGLDEAEIVSLAGEAACTVCYPSAPVETLGLPNLLDTAERKAEKDARQAEKAEKTAARIAKGVTPDGTTLVVTWERPSTRRATRVRPDGLTESFEEPCMRRSSKEIKTERAAELWVVEALAGKAWDRPTPEAINVVLKALAWKRSTTPADVEKSLAAKVAKKRKAY